MMKILHIGNYYPIEGKRPRMSYLVEALQNQTVCEHKVVAINRNGAIGCVDPVVATIPANNRHGAVLYKDLLDGIKRDRGKLKGVDVVHVFIDQLNGELSDLIALYGRELLVPKVTTLANLDDIYDFKTLREIIERSDTLVLPVSKAKELNDLTSTSGTKVEYLGSVPKLIGLDPEVARDAIRERTASRYMKIFEELVTTY